MNDSFEEEKQERNNRLPKDFPHSKSNFRSTIQISSDNCKSGQAKFNFRNLLFVNKNYM